MGGGLLQCNATESQWGGGMPFPYRHSIEAQMLLRIGPAHRSVTVHKLGQPLGRKE